MAVSIDTPVAARRELLGAGAALLLLGAPTAANAAGSCSDAAMIQVCAEYHRVNDARSVGGLDADVANELTLARWKLLGTLGGWIPRTSEGLRAKAGVAFSALHCKLNSCLNQTWREQADAEEIVAVEVLQQISGLPEPLKVLKAPLPNKSFPVKPDLVCGDDAELIAACERFIHLETEYQRLIDAADGFTAEHKAAQTVLHAMHGDYQAAIYAVANLPARTLEGLQAKGRAIFAFHGDVETYGNDCPHELMEWSLISDLAGEA